MIVANTEAELRFALAQHKVGTIGFVPTMGALHEGHLSLIEIAKQNSDFVVVSIFVNPLQFSQGEDFEKYPRVLDADLELLLREKVDLVFAPTVETIYPAGQVITEHSGELGEKFEGAIRPGHFDGMLTVVRRLFELVEPNIAVFGQKDAQQVALIKQMLLNTEFAKPIRLLVGPTIREDSGLALSSRNRYLSKDEIEAATSISAALFAADGSSSRDTALNSAKDKLDLEARLEYLELVDEHFQPVTDDFQGEALMIIACRIGQTRLIDNHRVRIERKA